MGRRAEIAHGENLGFVAPAAGGRGRAGLGLGRDCKILRDFPHPRRFQFKGGVAMVANVVVTALRLARIEHLCGATLRADDGDGREGHGVSSMAQRERLCQGARGR